MASWLSGLSILRRLVLVELRSQLQYRLSFVFDVLSTLVVTLAEFGALALVLPRFDHLGGWTVGEVALLYGLINMSFGLTDMIFSGFDPADFGRHVRMGTFDQLLLRPVNITLQVLGLEFHLRRIGRILIGMGILVYAFQLNPIEWTAAKAVVMVLAIFGQIAYFGGLLIIGASISFWTIESIEVVNIFTYGGTELIAYPMSIYPRLLRQFFTYILPAIFLNYYPGLYILSKTDPLGMPNFAHWLAPGAGLVIFFIALRFWRFGLTKYQSTGT